MCAAAALDEFIYVTGGANFEVVDTVFRYSLLTQQWEIIEPMLSHRRAHQLVALAGKLYAIGGYGEGRSNYCGVEEYDPTRRQWRHIGGDLYGFCFASATVFNGEIYVCGSKRFVKFNPARGWTNLPPLDAKEGRTLVAIGDRLLALGGGHREKGGTKAVCEFVKDWSSRLDMEMNIPLRNHCSFVVKC